MLISKGGDLLAESAEMIVRIVNEGGEGDLKSDSEVERIASRWWRG